MLKSLVDAAYQASLLREENTAVQCRILVASPDDPELNAAANADSLYVVQFDESAEFTPQHVRKLAAAVGYYRSLIGVQILPNHTLSTWGMVVTGAGWVNHTESTVHEASILPRRLVIHILGPGHLVFASGFNRVFETIGGQILMEGFDPFRSEWLPKCFEDFRLELLSNLSEYSHPGGKTRLCESFVRDVAQNVVRRVLGLVRAREHGGMLIYLSDSSSNNLNNWLRIRMRFKHANATNRFPQLMLKLMRRALEVGTTKGMEEVHWQDFLQMQDIVLGELHDSLVEYSHFLADLMGVDGSLVLDRRFRLIGFGAEILGDSHVVDIERAIDLEAIQSVTEPADASGTRHRSAYRLVSSIQDAIVLVVSQDGAVRFVAHHGGRLVYWPYLP